jgi:glycosyltransferase involved in cell wall biosynthesis
MRHRAVTYRPDLKRGFPSVPDAANGSVDPFGINIMQVNADATAEAAINLGPSFFAGRYTIGAWMWELPEFPMAWMDRFRYVDEIWAASAFACDAIAQVSPLPVVRMPVPIAAPRPSALPRSHFDLDPSSYVFLFVFDYGSVAERKNPLALVEAFRSAFRVTDNAVLVLKSSRAAADPTAHARLREAVKGLPVRLIDGTLSREELDALFSHADCYVSLHRSEGYGLTLAEAMRAGKPVIATGWSGNVDFMTTANSFLVRHRIVELDRDHPPYRKGTHWAQPDVAHAAELMRHVYENRDDAARVARLGQADIERELSFERVGALIRNRLELIEAGALTGR